MKELLTGFVASTVALAACGPAVDSAAFGEFSPNPPDHPIRLFSTKLPDCPYEEVGLVRVSDRGNDVSLQEMLESLRERAREMGGDAVVGLGQTRAANGGVVIGEFVSTVTHDGLAGTVIRYSDGSCRDAAAAAPSGGARRPQRG